MTETIKIDKKAIKLPYSFTRTMLRVIAPGPTRRGKAIGTIPELSGSIFSSSHEPLRRILIDIIKSKTPPATLNPDKDILKIFRKLSPKNAKKKRRKNDAKDARDNILLLFFSLIPEEREIIIGTFPMESIIINRDIVALNKEKSHSLFGKEKDKSTIEFYFDHKSKNIFISNFKIANFLLRFLQNSKISSKKSKIFKKIQKI